jgi:hypothetical protein
MWELIIRLPDAAQAQQALTGIDSRPETATPGVRVTKYPNDQQLVVRSVERAPLASLGKWALDFTSARVTLVTDSGSPGEY